MDITAQLAEERFSGLCFVNLVDFDMQWGHRRDAVGYACGLNAFDRWLGGFLPRLSEGDAVIITADHGCDPGFLRGTDHTREYVPFLLWQKGRAHRNYGTRQTFSDVAATVAALLEIPFSCDGSSMI